jgi:arylsulfatase A-like enzyme
LRPQEVTIAELLQKAGYRTGHFGKWHLGSLREDSPVNPGNSGFDEWFSSPNFFDLNPWMCRNGRAEKVSGESSEVTVDAAIEFIRESAPRKEPFLAVVWFGSPHAPHQGTPEDLALYQDQPAKRRQFLAKSRRWTAPWASCAINAEPSSLTDSASSFNPGTYRL